VSDYYQTPECRHELDRKCSIDGCKSGRLCQCKSVQCERAGCHKTVCTDHYRAKGRLMTDGTITYDEVCVSCLAKEALSDAQDEVAELHRRIVEEDIDRDTLISALYDIANGLAVAA
jgi:hypothetical protein